MVMPAKSTAVDAAIARGRAALADAGTFESAILVRVERDARYLASTDNDTRR